ncbi:hypothetical protein [Staphylococcus phage vB_SauH_DELF3]|nr:hypothetical protein [Staphylococcus phage vB_SauH_DELF3]
MDIVTNKFTRDQRRDNRHHRLFNEKFNNEELIVKINHHGGQVTYYRNSVVPFYVLFNLSAHRTAHVVYRMSNQLNNIKMDKRKKSFMGTNVIGGIPVTRLQLNPYDLRDFNMIAMEM